MLLLLKTLGAAGRLVELAVGALRLSQDTLGICMESESSDPLSEAPCSE